MRWTPASAARATTVRLPLEAVAWLAARGVVHQPQFGEFGFVGKAANHQVDHGLATVPGSHWTGRTSLPWAPGAMAVVR